jgi:uncharacterized zinc-type alcohol dehydrogenase-like protein
MPGHEIVGRVTAVGANVSKHKVGDLVGVGCMVDSCRECQACAKDLEQYCLAGPTMTYATPDRLDGSNTMGGYSNSIVVSEHFVLRMPQGLDLASAAPLLCAGITTYSPFRQWGIGPGQKVGVVGLGGLGHMGVKIARAMGAHVVLFTTTPDKRDDALRLGAHEVVVSKDKDEMKAHAGSFDFILNTVAASHNLDAFTRLLKRDGTLVLVGVPEHAHPSPSVSTLIMGRKAIAGSVIGGIAETQEMLDYCAANGIASDIERIEPGQINVAYERMLKGDVKYRFVIDVKSL